MFSKALFRQSCKANGTMWSVVTFAVCFMLACVMLISGNGSIGEVKNSIQDTIIVKEIDAGLEKRAVNYYANAADGTAEFDRLFIADATDTTMNSVDQILLYEGLKYAVVIVASLPVMCLYPFLHRYFVKGTMIGAVKG